MTPSTYEETYEDERVAVSRAHSFEDYVQATAAQMFRAAVLLCGDHHLAEDLVQTAYTKIYVNWRRVRAADNPVAYGRTVLTRTFLSHRRLKRSDEQPTETLPDQGASVDPTIRLDLLQALRRLKPEDRAVLVLRYWLDLSVADTADVLNVSTANVRQRTHRAITRLRVQLPDLADTDAELGLTSTTHAEGDQS